MIESFDGKNKQLNFYNPDHRANEVTFEINNRRQKSCRVKSIIEYDQPSQVFQKVSNNKSIANQHQQSVYNVNQTWSQYPQIQEISNIQDLQYPVSRVSLYGDTFLSYGDQMNKKRFKNEDDPDNHNIYNENENQSYDEYKNEDMRGTYQNSDSQQLSSELFANIKQMKIFQYMKDYVKTLKKNKIIQRIWFCQLNNRWTQQRSLSVSFFMMSTCILMILLVCWIIILIYMFQLFDDTYHPNYLTNQKNQLLNSLSSAEDSIFSIMKKTDHLHNVVINIFQSQQKHRNNPFYDISSDSKILVGKKKYISIKENVSPADENNLGFSFGDQKVPLTYNFFQWAAFRNQKNYLDISPESQQTIDDFDIVNYFMKNLIGHAKYSQSFSYYCSFERDELVIYYPAGLQSSLKNMDQVEGFSFHPKERDWYSSIIKNNLQQTNETYISIPYIDQITSQYTITMSAPLRDYDDNFIGVCATDFLLPNLVNYLGNMRINVRTTVILLNSKTDAGIVLSNNTYSNFTTQSTLGIQNQEWADMKESILSKYGSIQQSYQKDELYSYFETIKGFKIGATAFKIKQQNSQLFIILLLQSQEDFENLYQKMMNEVYDKYIKPNIVLMIIFVVIYSVYIAYSLLIARFITQPYRDIKQISLEIMKNQKVSNQLGSIIAYFNTLNFRHDQILQNLVKSAMILVQKISKVSSKKIIDNQKYSNAVHAEYNQYWNTQMEWRDSIQQLKDNDYSSENFVTTQSEIALCDSTNSLEKENTPFPLINNIYNSHKQLKQKVILDDSPKYCIKSSIMANQNFMNHIQQYLPSLPIP